MLHVRPHAYALVLLVAGLGSCASSPTPQGPGPAPGAPAPGARVEEPVTRLGLALSRDAAWLTAGTRLRRAGWLGVELFGNDADDYAISGTFLRMGGTDGEEQLSLGVGISAYAFHVDLDDDADGGAVALRGLATYAIPTSFPSQLAAELALAPDVSSFGDGEGLLDASLRYELDVSEFASAFIGYRLLEVDVAGASDQTLEDGIHIGVRLAY